MQKKAEFYFHLIGLILSGATAYFAYSIGSEQVRAAKIQYAPIFVFKKDYTKDYVNDVYKTEYLSIENQGYPILSFSAVLDTVLTLKLTEYSKKTPPKVMYYPTRYFDGQSSSSGGKGQLSMFIGNNNLWLMSDFQNEVGSFNEKNNGKRIVNYVTNTIVKISYIDANDEHHDKYFIDEKPVTLDAYNKLNSKIEGVSDLGKKDLNLYKLLSISE
ncbi:hypothetical protein J8628_15035 [Serratia fonticola]|uniref:hypothetical protein n=1 Tax=Serratia fonticola TaxID=47917 RepID=UPI001AE4A28F|nr:hypothetical protein [Serratia fonticola]MBP1018233.1 hypothetical protein [Serratia fonticola]